MIFLNKEDIKKCFSMKDAILADKIALKTYSEKSATVPLRTNINVKSKNGQTLFMPGLVEANNTALGIKIVSVYPDNINHNIPSVPATMIVLDANTGIVNAILDGTYLTQLRTGAVSGAGIDLLAKKDSKIGALIGTGGQAECQLEAMITVRNLDEIRIFDIDNERAVIFANDMSKKYSINVKAVKTAKECVENADIITTVTTSKIPTFKSEWVKEGAHINGVGSYTPQMCEIPKELIKKADIIVFDTMEGVISEAGDFINPLKENFISVDKYNGELGELILNKISGRTNERQITIFKTVGTAVLDVYVASEIVKKALEKGLGKQID